MNIGLIDVDGHNFPNLALMKISAFHKSKGDNVEFVQLENYDKTYISKVFTFTPDYIPSLSYLGEIVKGGTGYNYNKLHDEIEHIYPDYSLYNINKAYGFLTRGCPNKCRWCIVPKKEGDICHNTDITEFWNGQNEAVLLDNNVLAHKHGLEQIEKIIELGIKIDFNQGLDCRIISENKDIAELLSKVKWSRYIRMACDTKSQIPYIDKAFQNLKQFGIKPYKLFFYVLVKDIKDALERVEYLKTLGGVRQFAQPYRDFERNINPSIEQRNFARWVNHPAIFNTVQFVDYRS